MFSVGASQRSTTIMSFLAQIEKNFKECEDAHMNTTSETFLDVNRGLKTFLDVFPFLGVNICFRRLFWTLFPSLSI